jgi:hypothetical protein
MTARIISGAWPLEFPPMAIKAPYRMDKRFCGVSIKACGRLSGRREFLARAVFHGE